MVKELREKIEQFLLDSNYKWNTSSAMIHKLNLTQYSPTELDELLIREFKDSENQKFRFSTLPSKKSLDVLWGHIDRVKKRDVLDIYKQDEQILIDELDRIDSKNLFLSHSFKDSEQVINLAKDLSNLELHAWIAETEILKYQHINQKVKEAIESLPYFGVFISKNLISSIWSAKEIEFALNNKKLIFGFLDNKLELNLEEIIEGNKISQEIFRRFFDNHRQVFFLNYPDSAKINFSGIDQCISWDELEEILDQ
ncbi:toll/interleukin-1 receptor domain-containing protein [Algoriphagus sp.]|uniref:toll/interleukin-1 receptor domain-containing protein n=1 Tax=Algoriphagus sp. TaxID=1872435 RepID=UPI0025DF8792|nr:toll/interleukin-1 receptor domain-containing protein [Algoriphagus sp.]